MPSYPKSRCGLGEARAHTHHPSAHAHRTHHPYPRPSSRSNIRRWSSPTCRFRGRQGSSMLRVWESGVGVSQAGPWKQGREGCGHKTPLSPHPPALSPQPSAPTPHPAPLLNPRPSRLFTPDPPRPSPLAPQPRTCGRAEKQIPGHSPHERRDHCDRPCPTAPLHPSIYVYP
jgi:hypothetical protein